MVSYLDCDPSWQATTRTVQYRLTERLERQTSSIVDFWEINAFNVNLDTGAVVMVEAELGHAALTWPMPSSSCFSRLQAIGVSRMP
nr:hypothetical protein [Bradyrhizobium betae]